MSAGAMLLVQHTHLHAEERRPSPCDDGPYLCASPLSKVTTALPSPLKCSTVPFPRDGCSTPRGRRPRRLRRSAGVPVHVAAPRTRRISSQSYSTRSSDGDHHADDDSAHDPTDVPAATATSCRRRRRSPRSGSFEDAVAGDGGAGGDGGIETAAEAAGLAGSSSARRRRRRRRLRLDGSDGGFVGLDDGGGGDQRRGSEGGARRRPARNLALPRRHRPRTARIAVRAG